MKKIIILFIVFFTINTTLKAQLVQKFQFTISPFSVLSTNHPSIRMGFDIVSSKKIVLSSDFNYGNDFLVSNKQYKTDYLFYQIRPMLKYNVVSEKSHDMYIGLEYFYFKKTSVQHGGYFMVENRFINYENADYLKAKEGINLILGLKIYTKGIIMGEIYAGAGYYHSYTSFSNILNGQFLNSIGSMLLFPEVAGYKTDISIIFGLKIGLNFGKKYEEPEKFDYEL